MSEISESLFFNFSFFAIRTSEQVSMISEVFVASCGGDYMNGIFEEKCPRFALELKSHYQINPIRLQIKLVQKNFLILKAPPAITRKESDFHL